MEITKIILISSSIAFASAGFSQYYITPHFVSHFSPAVPVAHQQPLTSQISQNSFIDFPSIYHAQPFFFSQNVNPFFQHTFPSPIPQVNVEQARSSNRQTSGRSLDVPQSDSVQGVEYGFGYRTQFDDGATSTVVFVSGPDSKKMNLLRSRKPEARKLASDILDAKTSEEKNEKINLALSNDIPGFNFDALVEAFPDFKPLEEHGTGVVHLFSHPANVFPLSTPTQTTTSIPETTPTSDSANNDDPESIAVESADNDTPLARSNENSEEEEKGAESIIQETKDRIGEIRNRNFEEQSSTESSSSTSSTSSESPNTSSKSEEEQETTTQQ